MSLPTEFVTRRTRFLDAFYGEGNGLTREGLAKSQTQVARVARQWEELLCDENSAAVLPRRQDKQWTWYAIAFDAPTLRDLGEQLMAFVGPSYSAFRGRHGTLRPQDPVEAAIIEFTGPYVFQLVPPDGSDACAEFIQALELMCRVRMSAVSRPRERVRSTGRLVRDFQMALAAGDQDQAASCLQVLGTQNLLDALNLRFLEVQASAARGDWKAIVESAHFRDLVQVRRPIAVTSAMVQAVYRVYLAGFEAAGRPEDAARAFQNEVLPQYAPLYRARSGLTHPDSMKSFMLLAVAASPPSPELRDELLAVHGLPETEAAYLVRLAALLPEASSRPAQMLMLQIDRAREALLAADFDRASSLAAAAPVSVERAAILLRSAYELSSTTAAGYAVEAVRGLDAIERDELFVSRAHRGFWESVSGTSSQNAANAVVPYDWASLLAQMDDATWSDARASEIAAAAPDQWDIVGLAADPGAVQRLVCAIDQAANCTSGPLLERFESALPHLLRHLEQDPGYPRRAFGPVYDRLRMALVYACVPATVSDLALFDDLCVASLELGCTEQAYGGIVGDADLLWRDVGAPASLRPMVDLLDQLFYYPSPLPCARARLVSQVFGRAAPWVSSGRVDGELLRLLRQLSCEYGVEQMLPSVLASASDDPEVVEDPLGRLAGLVAIHTLTYPAGLRAKEILKVRSPQCEVVVNSDKVGTNQLRDLARAADIFVIVTGSAKHAASEFVSTHRPSTRPLVRPRGKGTTSILQALADHARSVH